MYCGGVHKRGVYRVSRAAEGTSTNVVSRPKKMFFVAFGGTKKGHGHAVSNKNTFNVYLVRESQWKKNVEW